MLDVKQLFAGYGRLTALKGIDLSVKQGEVVFVVGPNGAGKSTLLKTIAGLMAPTSGTITFKGSLINGKAPEQLCRSGLALIPEGRHIFKTLTVEENLAVGAMIRRKSSDRDIDLAQVLDTFPILRDRFKGIAGHLSGGEQQQLAIARAILQRPSLLMIDEPSLGLAPLVIDQVYESLRKLNTSGLTLLIVEQSTGRIMELASRIYVFRNGNVVLEGTPEKLSSGEAVEAAYFGFGEEVSA
ncbi:MULTISPECIES: ABC transporter ATP-binding protein [unclassified Mesorhizobium]|uniref:ABC transporter ATP-binding protein n=1 Tax=unclassified Mesorhizobium TaxID=325217 RepID=UPI000FCB29B8|nr:MULTISPECIES: ABC transporter ATP-binding protein [unclassified Mesorhizobium]TGP18216.1 ABC transporter ATP-binding protein [Mesorhizobium sp. M1D.F.Ca.ET.231.01.1.1]TGP25454.1 ABC transporter ATP-binding protein [Mesorhizobium sp. M1D.F.Ca.ET.234.01.1.1]TGS38340.1 ABC transporter ATP-binding protein [Mesorhizobium sp. M1D.F.Ca.ET.184.01.1.1]TGS58347.1 ABC transporter ATP-binding protein [Mesorhizobium sp. M1D.F.Ca.ET.183.01.1.1]